STMDDPRPHATRHARDEASRSSFPFASQISCERRRVQRLLGSWGSSGKTEPTNCHALREDAKTDPSEVMDCGIHHQRKHERPSGQCEWSPDPKEGPIDLLKNGKSDTSTVERRERQ